MTLRPLGHKILVKPDQAPTQTDSGFYIPDGVDVPPMSGTVLALGDGPYRDRQLRRATVAKCLEILDRADREECRGDWAVSRARDEMQQYMTQADDLAHVCEVGQRVIFPMEAGHEIILGEKTDDAVIVLAEDSLLAVYEKEPATV